MRKYIAGFLLLLALTPNALSAYTAIQGKDQLRIDQNIEDNVYAAG